MVLLGPVVDADCPVEEFKKLPHEGIAKNKYSVLVASAEETQPTFLTPCLYIAISKAIEDVGRIKGVVESEVNGGEDEASDIASPEDRDATQAILDRLLNTQLFERLAAELGGTLSAPPVEE